MAHTSRQPSVLDGVEPKLNSRGIQSVMAYNITFYRLRQLYSQHRIKQWVLRFDIQLNQKQLEGQRDGKLIAFPRVLKAVNGKEELLFMD